MKVLIFTMIRKGSKRFPGKNTAPLMGKPLYKHTVDHIFEICNQLQRRADFEDVNMLLAHDYGLGEIDAGLIDIFDIPKKYSGSDHSYNSELITQFGEYDYYIMLQATSPIRNCNDIANCFVTFVDGGFDCAIMGKKIKSPIYSFDGQFDFFTLVNGEGALNDERSYNWKSADSFQDTGSCYFFKKSQLDKSKSHITDTDSIMYMADNYGWNIDYEKDLHELARRLTK